jgi:D-xylulose reductase
MGSVSEVSGTVVEVGVQVTHLKPGDRVCTEPLPPAFDAEAALRGLHLLNPVVRIESTPSVVHPAAFTHKLPDNVSFAEGAIVEPLSIGLQAATKAKMKPGDIAVVIGAGTIGAMTALAALAGGASRVIVADLQPQKLALLSRHPAITGVDIRSRSLVEVVQQATEQWGADVVFEASGSVRAFDNILDLVCPGGCVVLVGMPPAKVPLDIVSIQSKEVRLESVFRHGNIFPRAIALIASGQIDVKPFISRTFAFADSVQAFEEAAKGLPGDVKIQIEMA